ncbi:MAG: hypothetical protein K6T73_11540 [Candidatus Bathyarchaeota archaeon]|nr:hypothetical protein [Candidatus Bathyarchaeota archaeon]
MVEEIGESIDPKAYQTILLHKMMKSLDSINKLLQSKEMKGVLVHKEVVVNGFAELDFLDVDPYRLLFRVDVFNKGDVDAQVRVNREGDWIPVEARAYQPLSFDKAHVRYLSMKTKNGTTTLKLVGVY